MVYYLQKDYFVQFQNSYTIFSFSYMIILLYNLTVIYSNQLRGIYYD